MCTLLIKILMLSSVASMIAQFNMPNLELLDKLGYEANIAANFLDGNTCSEKQLIELKEHLAVSNIPFYHIGFSRKVTNVGANIKAYYQMKNLIKEQQYKVVHCQSPIGGVITRLATRKTDVSVIYTAHGFHFYQGAPWLNWLLYYPIEKWLARYTDVLITINKEDYERAKRSFKAGRIEYVPGVGVDVEKCGSVVVDRKAKRKELGLAEDDFVLVSTGELNDNKNHKTVIHVVNRLNNPSVKYLICGQGPLRNELLNLVQELGLEHQVMLLGFRTDVIEINHIADVFVFPSFREGLSVALMEAMACGLPVVCSDIRGNRDLVEEGKGGFLVEPSNVIGFSDSIKALAEDATLRMDMAKYNMMRVRNFALGVVMEKMKDIYRSVSHAHFDGHQTVIA